LAALQDLQGPVLADDAAEAGRPATIAHANSHAFEESVNAYLTGEEIQPPPNISTSEELPQHDHGSSKDDSLTGETSMDENHLEGEQLKEESHDE